AARRPRRCWQSCMTSHSRAYSVTGSSCSGRVGRSRPKGVRRKYCGRSCSRRFTARLVTSFHTRAPGGPWWRRARRAGRLTPVADRRATPAPGRPRRVAPTSSVTRRSGGKSKLYTRTGDLGTTMIFGGGRLPKDHPRVEAYGTVDELNSTLGVALTFLPARG